MINFSAIHIPATRVTGIGAGVVGLAAGAAIAATITRSFYLQDAFADSYQVLDQNGDYVLQRPRPKIGPVALGSAIVTGGALAGASAFVHSESAWGSLWRQGLREGGMGLIAGSVAAAWLYQNAQVAKK